MTSPLTSPQIASRKLLRATWTISPHPSKNLRPRLWSSYRGTSMQTRKYGERDTRGRWDAPCLIGWHLITSLLGKEPTFQKGERTSHVDVTPCFAGIAGLLGCWQVLTCQENLSDHFCIDHTISTQIARLPPTGPPHFKLTGTDSLRAAITKVIGTNGSQNR